MGIINDLLALAHERGQQLGLPYQGALTPREAYELLQSAPGARLVDVRSRAEWDFVGRIPQAVEVEWRSYPGMVQNEHFLVQLQKQADPEALLLFLCRSGQRSHQAALAASEAGFANCYNILEGFEGDRDAEQHRNRIGGWRHAGLPWYQS